MRRKDSIVSRLKDAGRRSVLPLIATVALCAVVISFNEGTSDQRIISAIGRIQRPSPNSQVSCPQVYELRPLVILALGQSNAGNHGEMEPHARSNVFTVFDGHCFLSTDPIPGATGVGASVWTRLPTALAEQGILRPVVIMNVAVESSAIVDWAPGRRLNRHLLRQIALLGQTGLKINLVLWHQGESDAKRRTNGADYRLKMEQLLSSLQASGVDAPVLVALSTYCPESDGNEIRSTLRKMTNEIDGVWLGPDTDMLTGTMRSGGCHFSATGLAAASRLWAQSIGSILNR